MTVFSVILFSTKIDKAMSNNTIILIGMVLSLFVNALLTTLTSFFSNDLKKIALWQMGSFAMRGWTYVNLILPFFLIGMIGVLRFTKEMDILTFGEEQAKKLGLKVFVPSLVIALAALGIAQFTAISGTAAIGVAAVIAAIVTFVITKAKPRVLVEESDRMLQSVGAVSILPQLLAALGALFTAAGVGDVISSGISGILPQGNIFIGVTAYCVGMALFTMIMGNAFAAFSVITVGIGIPFVFAQGANVAIAGALALTAGYCGTLLTPMAANFNIMPAALLEIEDKNAIIKQQAPVALILLAIHILLMYFLAF